MKLFDVIAEYVTLQESLGQRFGSRRYLLRAFNRAVGSKIEIQAVRPTKVRAFLGQPTTQYWSKKYSTLACFYRYAVSRGHVNSSPLPKTIPKIPTQFVPYIYTHDEVRQLLEATYSYRNIHILLEPHTFRAILLLLYGAGLQIGEALQLHISDINLSEAVLLIRGTKFYKSRVVPMGLQLQQAMLQFAATRRKAGQSEAADAPFFVGRGGDQLTIHTVQSSFRQLREHAGNPSIGRRSLPAPPPRPSAYLLCKSPSRRLHSRS